MNYLHYDFNLDSGDLVEVVLDKQANVRLLDDSDYASYRQGRPHHYYGGLAEKSPVRLVAPRTGHWHVVIDLGGYPGSVKASARALRAAS